MEADYYKGVDLASALPKSILHQIIIITIISCYIKSKDALNVYSMLFNLIEFIFLLSKALLKLRRIDDG